MKLKLALAATIAATFLVVSGCGSSDDTSSADTQQDKDDITALVADIDKASREKDALASCGLMQPSGVTEVFNTQSQCVRETKKILELNSADQPRLKVENIEVDGDTATVTLENDIGGAPITVVKEGGKWYVPLSSDAAPGLTGTTDE